MYFGLFIALVPLFIGYLFKTTNPHFLAKINQLLSWIVYFILFLMGAGISQLDNLSTHLLTIISYAVIFFGATFGCNFIALLCLDSMTPWTVKPHEPTFSSRLRLVTESLRVCVAILLGFMCGFIPSTFWSYNEQITRVILVIMMLLIGISLRGNNISLRQILLNKLGMMTTFFVIVSALFGGMIAAWIVGLPTHVGFALSSGFGWYSLSGFLMTDAQGPVIGGVAFLNDILRELVAIILIPSLVKRQPITTLGLCGATSMDFTLPMLQKGAGIAIVPPAIVQGFLLTLLMPILMTFFNCY